MSLTNHERDGTPEQKAKDWDGLEKFCKRDRLDTSKVHALKLGHGQGSMYGEDMLMLH